MPPPSPPPRWEPVRAAGRQWRAPPPPPASRGTRQLRGDRPEAALLLLPEPRQEATCPQPRARRLESGTQRGAPPRRPGWSRGPAQPPPQQSVRVRNKAADDLLKLEARNLPVGFGATWKQHLAAGSEAVFYEANGICCRRKKTSRCVSTHGVFTCTRMCSPGAVQVSPWAGIHVMDPTKLRAAPPPPGVEDIHGAPSTDMDGAVHPGRGEGPGRPSKVFYSALLSVPGHQARSQTEKGWAQFPEAGVSWLNQNSSGLVFMLRGSYAQKGSAIHRKHHILQTAHPSPLSVYRGFSGGRHFSKNNELLQKSGKEPINWKDL